jgi:hypothetical protein
MVRHEIFMLHGIGFALQMIMEVERVGWQMRGWRVGNRGMGTRGVVSSGVLSFGVGSRGVVPSGLLPFGVGSGEGEVVVGAMTGIPHEGELGRWVRKGFRDSQVVIFESIFFALLRNWGDIFGGKGERWVREWGGGL